MRSVHMARVSRILQCLKLSCVAEKLNAVGISIKLKRDFIRQESGICVYRSRNIKSGRRRKHCRKTYGLRWRRSRRVYRNLLNINNNLFWKLCRNTKCFFLLVSFSAFFSLSSTWSRWNRETELCRWGKKKKRRREKINFYFLPEYKRDPNIK